MNDTILTPLLFWYRYILIVCFFFHYVLYLPEFV